MHNLKIIFVSVVITAFAVCNNVYARFVNVNTSTIYDSLPAPPKPPAPPKAPPPPRLVYAATIEKLVSIFEKDSTKALSRYQHEYFNLTGTVVEVKKTSTGSILVLKDLASSSTVYIEFKEDQKVKNLPAGTRVKMEARCEGWEGKVILSADDMEIIK
jgi:hypothetical protein